MNELANLLAESSLRMNHINQLQRKRIGLIPPTQDRLMRDRDSLHERITNQGIGTNPDDDAQYLQTLQTLRSLDQSHEVARLKLPPEEVPADVRKSIDYGRRLLEVYGGGVLVKGASADLESLGAKLAGMSYSEAQQIGKELLSLCNLAN